MTAPERFADSQIPLAPRAPSIHDLVQSMRDYSAAAPESSVVPPSGPTRRDTLRAMPFARPEGAGTAPVMPV
jgi:hypothetical protein